MTKEALHIPLSEPVLKGKEWEYVKDCLDSGWISSASPFVSRFEEAIASHLGSGHAVALASGTAALHLALKIAGVKAGDYVLVSDLTFVAPVNAIRYVGAHPILVDPRLDTWQMDHHLLAEWLENETETREGSCYWPQGEGYIKAMIPVHILGGCGELDKLLQLSQDYGIPMIEDASESLGATYAGRSIGTWGQLSCLSFNGNKIITTGGGGMFWSQNPEPAKRARHLSTQARTDGIFYTHDEVGYNYRLPGVLAAIGLAQLEQLPQYLKARRDNARHYQSVLSACKTVQFQHHPEQSHANHWLVALRSIHKKEILNRLLSQNIHARNIWAPMHRLPMYQKAPYIQHQRHSATLFEEVICLPSSANLGKKDIQRISQEVLKACREI